MTVMSSKRGHMNIVDYDQVDSDREQSYSSDELDEVMFDGDRYECEEYSEVEEDDINQAEEEVIIYKETYADKLAKEDSMRPRLCNPKDMTVILPPRVLPSVEEMNSEWDNYINNVLAKEYITKLEKMGAIIKASWDVRRAKAEAEKKTEDLLKWRMNMVSNWRKRMRGFEGISRLGSLTSFEKDEKLMRLQEADEAKAKEELDKQAVIQQAQLAADKAKKKASLEFKEREMKKLGMNKKTDAHRTRAVGALVFKTKTSVLKPVLSEAEKTAREADKAARTAANAEKNKAKEKAKILWMAENARAQAIQKPKVIAIDYIAVEEAEENEEEAEQNAEQKAEQKAEQEAEQKAEDDALKAFNIASVLIVEAREAREEKDKAKKAEVDALEAESDALEVHFISTMAKSMGMNEYHTTAIKDEKKLKIDLGFVGLISQKKAERCLTDAKYAKRSEAFSDLADKTKLEEVLTFTTLCKSVTSGKKCYHTNCRFAHSIEHLKPRECRFGQSCGFVKKMENGQYMNAKFGRTGKSCSAMHPGEDQKGLASRLGVKHTNNKVITLPANVQVAIPVQISAPTDLSLSSEHANAMTSNTWSNIVYKSLSEDEKNTIYGKGIDLINKQGYVDGAGLGKHTDGIIDPIDLSSSRMPWQKTGLGYSVKSAVCVTAKGFSWVKGAVLEPEKRPRKVRWDVKPKYMIAIDAINQRLKQIPREPLLVTSVTKIEKPVVSVTAKGFSWVKGAIIEPEKRSRKVRWDVKPKFMIAIDELNQKLEQTSRDDVIIADAVAKAKAKAVEINKRLADKASWTMVRSAYTKPKQTTHIKKDEVVFRVPEKDAQLALLAAIRNGISNFRIEFSDKI